MRSGLVAQDESRTKLTSPRHAVGRMRASYGRIRARLRARGPESAAPRRKPGEENATASDRRIVTEMDDRPLDSESRSGIGNGRCLVVDDRAGWPEIAGPVRRFLTRIVGAERSEDLASDTMLIAPITVGDGASTGAGSVVTKDVADGDLVVGVPAKRVTSDR